MPTILFRKSPTPDELTKMGKQTYIVQWDFNVPNDPLRSKFYVQDFPRLTGQISQRHVNDKFRRCNHKFAPCTGDFQFSQSGQRVQRLPAKHPSDGGVQTRR